MNKKALCVCVLHSDKKAKFLDEFSYSFNT